MRAHACTRVRVCICMGGTSSGLRSTAASPPPSPIFFFVTCMRACVRACMRAYMCTTDSNFSGSNLPAAIARAHVHTHSCVHRHLAGRGSQPPSLGGYKVPPWQFESCYVCVRHIYMYACHSMCHCHHGWKFLRRLFWRLEICVCAAVASVHLRAHMHARAHLLMCAW